MRIVTAIPRWTTTILAGLVLSVPAAADELTLRVEQDLAELGYDTGAVDGEESLETTIAISQFQAENNLEVTGAITPQLAGILAAHRSGGAPAPAAPAAANSPSAPAPGAATPPADPAALQAAQNVCLQEKMAAAQESQKKKRGFGRLLNAAVRTATRQGNSDMVRTASDIYNANATAEDLAAAAKDLGLTESDIEACRNVPVE